MGSASAATSPSPVGCCLSKSSDYEIAVGSGLSSDPATPPLAVIESAAVLYYSRISVSKLFGAFFAASVSVSVITTLSVPLASIP